MNNGEKEKLMTALEQAATESFGALKSIASWATCDKSAANYGALSPRVAHILGWNGPRVLRGLKAAVKSGRVIQSGPSYKYGMARYWPVGLLEKIQKGGAEHG